MLFIYNGTSRFIMKTILHINLRNKSNFINRKVMQYLLPFL